VTGYCRVHEPAVGPKAKWFNARFCAAVDGQADIKRAQYKLPDL